MERSLAPIRGLRLRSGSRRGRLLTVGVLGVSWSLRTSAAGADSGFDLRFGTGTLRVGVQMDLTRLGGVQDLMRWRKYFDESEATIPPKSG